MAIIAEWTQEQQEAFDKWKAEFKGPARALADRFPPDRLYLLKPANLRVTIFCYHDNDSITVSASGIYNRIMFNRRLWGISPNDLEECALPPATELLGTILTTPEAVAAYVQQLQEEAVNSPTVH